jgi:UDP-GlcNAc3NAcA epimerase
MPEELNRVLADHAASLLLCSSPAAAATLRDEHVAGEVVVVGDVMVDVFELVVPRADPGMLERLGVRRGEYVLATAHRAGNVDDPARLVKLVELLEDLPLPAIFPLHPRTRARLEAAGLLDRVQATTGLRLVPPLGYLDFLILARNARAVVTDSGGVQKEAYLLGTPCVTLRDTTEWVETVESGWNMLVDLDRDAALSAIARPPPAGERPELYGGGRAGQRIADAVAAYTARS